MQDSRTVVRETVRAWLAEDVGPGDVTVRIVPEDARAQARVLARAPCVLSGTAHAQALWDQLGVTTAWRHTDGDAVTTDEVLLELEGPARAILTGERVCLNLLMLASGVATHTRAVVEAVSRANPACEVLATRKTPPGLRDLVHDAVRHGGGDLHRKGLHDAVLIKENHIALVGDIATAVEMAREVAPTATLGAEARTPQEALDAARAGAHVVLLDNMPPDTVADAAELVKRLRPEVRLEASGGLDRTSATRLAPHVDRVSLGALTRAPWADMSLLVDRPSPPGPNGDASATEPSTRAEDPGDEADA